jgi:hypothetical protein
VSGRVEIDEEGMAEFEASIVDACDAVIKSVTDEARQRAPRRTGNLVSRIESTGSASAGYRIESNADYGAYVERGTDKFAPEPYLRPSIHTERVITQ